MGLQSFVSPVITKGNFQGREQERCKANHVLLALPWARTMACRAKMAHHRCQQQMHAVDAWATLATQLLDCTVRSE